MFRVIFINISKKKKIKNKKGLQKLCLAGINLHLHITVAEETETIAASALHQLQHRQAMPSAC